MKLWGWKVPFNQGIIWIQLTYGIFNFGMSLIFPYLTLQMRNIGLTYEDISYIYGLIPLLTFFGNPVLCFVGDRLGYNLVIIVSILLTAACATAFDFTPRFNEDVRTPTATLFRSEALSSYQLDNVKWGLCGEEATVEACQAFITDNVFANLTDYLHCGSVNETTGDFPLADFQLGQTSVIHDNNGTFCQAESDYEPNFNQSGAFLTVCHIEHHPDLSTCVDKSGSHSLTFWVYLALRTLYQLSMNVAYNLLDSTSVQLADQHKSDYAKVLLITQITAVFAPFITSAVIKDPEPGSDVEVDYSLMFYIFDGLLLVSCLLCLKLNVGMPRSDEKVTRSLRRIFSIPASILFFQVFVLGIFSGIRDAYLFVYLQEDLNASTPFISLMVLIGSISSVFMTLISKPIIKKVGEINLLTLAILVEAIRYVIFSQVAQSPPYYALGLAILDGFCFTTSFICIIYHTYKIAPPDLIGTMTGTVSMVQWVIGKGLASLVGGQIIAQTNIGVTGLFFWMAIATIGCAILSSIVYHLWIKGYEVELLREKAELLERMRDQEVRKVSVILDDQEIQIKKFSLVLEDPFDEAMKFASHARRESAVTRL